MKKISFELSEQSIGKAIKELKAYQKEINRKQKLLLERLALIGAQEASVRFATAIYDGVNDVNVNLRRVKDGWAIVAKGQAVCFIEFGSGIYHNPSEPYPNPRPDGVVGIGEYGKGRGKRRAWGYYGEPGSSGVVKTNKKTGKEFVLTRGNPAAMPMWYATEEMRRSILQIAREVFSGA